MKTANGTFQCRATLKNSLLMRFCFRDTPKMKAANGSSQCRAMLQKCPYS